MHLKKEEKEEDFFINYKEEEEYEVLSFFPTPLVVEKEVGGVEFSNLPYLDSGQNLNPTFDDMADLRYQVIAVDDDK